MSWHDPFHHPSPPAKRDLLAGRWRLVLLVTLACALWFGTPLAADAQDNAVGSINAHAHRLAKAIEEDILRVEPYLERYGYWAVFAAVGVEGFGIPAPGQTLLEAGAIVAAVPNSRLKIEWLLLVTILATALGQAIGYLIGRTGGRAILNRLPIPAQHLQGIEQKFNRYGGWLLVFGRFVDGPRQLMGLFAGALEMHWGRFLLLNLLGAVLWASFWALGVYYLDLHFDALVAALRHLNPWMEALGLFGVIALLLAILIAVLNRPGKAQP
ncbi:MAG: DedA family protein [Lamprobacter sp.]|uniref:DedA family protein n=1 Tax=Lamprobacter sp. TaxID=3100796 RepID=UPI002B257D92|nr:DedA family protein [Lamprobacter sp.]MEA3642472.1 DedA family protein [Lamprobacter sp.]